MSSHSTPPLEHNVHKVQLPTPPLEHISIEILKSSVLPKSLDILPLGAEEGVMELLVLEFRKRFRQDICNVVIRSDMVYRDDFRLVELANEMVPNVNMLCAVVFDRVLHYVDRSSVVAVYLYGFVLDSFRFSIRDQIVEDSVEVDSFLR